MAHWDEESSDKPNHQRTWMQTRMSYFLEDTMFEIERMAFDENKLCF